MARVAQSGRAVALFAHPGHELRIWGWLVGIGAEINILTDGSGSAGTPRLARTTKLLDEASLQRGPVYGRYTDREFYQLLLDRRQQPVLDLVAELAEHLRGRDIRWVIADAAEGYNPTHDVCCLIAVAVAGRLQADGSPGVELLNFPLAAQWDEYRAVAGAPRVTHRLDSDGWGDKLRAIEQYKELAAEVDDIRHGPGIDCLREESLWVAGPGPAHVATRQDLHFERVGRERVQGGVYKKLITYREHIAPLAKALRGGHD